MGMRERETIGARGVVMGAMVTAAAMWLGLIGGCVASGRVESSSADLLDLAARQTAGALSEYERDLQAVDSDREHAVVASLAERVKRDGAEKVDLHAAALQQALDKIAADRQVARQRYEAAMDNVQLMHEVAGGLRRYGERLRQYGSAIGQ